MNQSSLSNRIFKSQLSKHMSPYHGAKSPHGQSIRNAFNRHSRSEIPEFLKMNKGSKESFQNQGNVTYNVSGGIHPRKLDKSIETIDS